MIMVIAILLLAATLRGTGSNDSIHVLALSSLEECHFPEPGCRAGLDGV